MGRFYDQITPELADFIREQHVFFVATGAHQGRINLSPKGMDTFRVLSETRVGYLDLTGSGIETAAHIRADGRVTVMFCAFTGKPLILRLYGRGAVVLPDGPEWNELVGRFSEFAGRRQIITVSVESVGTSCGMGVPEMEFRAERRMLVDWAEKKGPDGVRAYWASKNRSSIDGLPAGLVDSA